MKKLMLLFALLGIFTTQAPAQKIAAKDVPANVSAAFAKTNPSVKDAEWSKAGNNFEAAFEADKKATTITYDPLGMLIESRLEIQVAALPAPALEYVKKNYKGDEVKKAYKVTDANETVTYVATVKDKNLSFDSTGNYSK